MATKKNKPETVNINIGGDANNSTIIVGDNNTVINTGEEKNYARFLVPFPHNPDFVGRDVELASLHEMLQKKESIVGIRPIALVGLGGIGKTQLAAEYAHAHREDYPSGVFWLNAINPLLIEFSDLAEKLEMSDRDTPRDKAARKAWDYLDAHPDALVIFDNVLEPSELNQPFSPDLVPTNLRCRTLFTTRQRDFPRTFQPFEVKTLPEMAAMKLLLRSRPEVLKDEHHPEWGWARIVCAYLGWLPLALELAAAYLGAYPDVSITGYLERLRTEGSLETVDESEVRAVDLPTRVEEILKAAAAGNLEVKHQVAVSATLQTQWKRLDDDGAKLLFRAAGQFPEASWIPIPRLGLLTGIESEAKAGRPSPLNVVLKKLHAVSLIEELSEDRMRLHPLVQEFAARLSPASASFRLEMAKRVAAEFDDLMRLQARVIHYGIDMALEDLRTALGFCMDKKETETYSRISKMECVLDRQAHGLRDWNAREEPAFFLQQIRHEAFVQELEQWKARAEAELISLKEPYLLERFPILSDPSELRTLAGHSGAVNAVALSADGRLAVSASGKTLKVWDVATGCELYSLVGHHSLALTTVALSVDGRLAVSASYDKTIKVWDVATGRELRTLMGHDGVVSSVALSADGLLLVSHGGKTIKVWDMETGRELRTLTRNVAAIALSADGRIAISAGFANCPLEVWDVETGCILRTFTTGHGEGVTYVALSADGQTAVSISANNTIKIWDVTTGQEVRTLISRGHGGGGVALSADGRLAAFASSDRTLKVWDVTTGHELCTLIGHGDEVNSIALSADGRLAVSASSDRTIKVWDVTARHQLRTLIGHGDVVNSMGLSSDGRLAVSASSDSTLKVWDVTTGHELCTLIGHSNVVKCVALSADGNLAVSASSDKTLKVWDVIAGHELRTLKSCGERVALSADGRLAISASDSRTFKAWDVPTGHGLFTLAITENYSLSTYTNNIALSANGQVAVSILSNPSETYNEIALVAWDVTTKDKMWESKRFPAPRIWDLALSADGRLAISVVNEEALTVWDVATGRELRTLVGHSNDVIGIALSTDGRLAVSASLDKTLKVWNVTAGHCIVTLLFGISPKCCAMSADGKAIVAGDVNGGVHFLELFGADELLAKDVKIEKSWLALKETQMPEQEEVEAHSPRLPRWLKGLLGRK